MKSTVHSIAAVLLGLFTLQGEETAKPAVELGAPFADQAILQRDMKVPVWGWAEPGVKVTVSFLGQKKEAVAGKDGKWMLKLEPLKASFEPAAMTVTRTSSPISSSMTVPKMMLAS